jgi:N-acetyl-anhydromuramyl-L-alanine amidase AmpD
MFWPLRAGRIVTSPFGKRGNEWHAGTDFGFPGGSGGETVYAIDAGTVRYCGAADGYGGPDPAGWVVIESPSGCWEYGHVRRVRNIVVGAKVTAGQAIAIVNPNSATNGGTAPHLHLSYMPNGYNPGQKIDPLPRLAGAAEPTGGTVTQPRPDFNEYPVWSSNNQARGGIKPDLWIIHTQEGNGNADSLARWMQGPVGVSYHYTISQDPKDNGVTVCDVVDTDRASWSVLNANNRSINLCFAGSSASWSREQWMRQSKAIDATAYLAVQDCRKYGIPIKVMPPNAYGPPGGITDHHYVTRYLGIGTHTDCGPNFPWDYFAERVAFWANPTAPPKPPTPPASAPATDRQLLERIDAKLDKIIAKLGA